MADTGRRKHHSLQSLISNITSLTNLDVPLVPVMLKFNMECNPRISHTNELSIYQMGPVILMASLSEHENPFRWCFAVRALLLFSATCVLACTIPVWSGRTDLWHHHAGLSCLSYLAALPNGLSCQIERSRPTCSMFQSVVLDEHPEVDLAED